MQTYVTLAMLFVVRWYFPKDRWYEKGPQTVVGKYKMIPFLSGLNKDIWLIKHGRVKNYVNTGFIRVEISSNIGQAF